VIVLVGYFIGQRWLRMAMLRQKTRPDQRKDGPPPLPGAAARRRLPPLTDGADPLVWKELHVGPRVTLRDAVAGFTRPPRDACVDDRVEEMGAARWFVASREVSAYTLRICAALVVLLLFGLTVGNVISPHWAVRIAGGLALCWLVSAVGLTAASGISRERQKRTLIDLLMLPGPRRALLRAKAVGALARGLWPALVLTAVVGTGVLGFGVSVLSAGLLLLTAAGLTLFSTALGIWLSARCRTALHATATWMGVMAGVVVGTFLLAEANISLVRSGNAESRLDYPAWARAANPLLAWGRLAFRYDWSAGQYVAGRGEDAWPVGFADVAPALVCPLAAAGAAGLLWLAAVRRFESEGRA
jgi:ABC-2 type transporter